MTALDLAAAILAVLFVRHFVDRWRHEVHSFMWKRQRYGLGRTAFRVAYAAWLAVQP
jgi:hypothetical protein